MKKISILIVAISSFINTHAQCWRTTSWFSWGKEYSAYDYTIAIKQDGTLWGWGANADGQLGNGTNKDTSLPIQIGTANNWKAIAAGTSSVLGIKNDGSLWGWGNNWYGQLGTGTFGSNTNIPVQIGTEKSWKYIACGFVNSFAIKNDGSLWATGENWYGHLGIGTNGQNTDKNIFTQVGTDTDWKQVTSGYEHTLAIKNDGTLWHWGMKLKYVSSTCQNTPIQFETDNDWEQVYASFDYGETIVGLKKDGTIWAWGLSNFPSNITVVPGDPEYYASHLTPMLITSDTMRQAVLKKLGLASNDVLNEGCDKNFELVTRTKDNSKFATYYESSAPAIGGNLEEEGRYVAFVSNAVGFNGSPGKNRQIFWKDRNSGEVKLVSVAADGSEGNGDSFVPSISLDGTLVAFESYATNLVQGDANGLRDIFVWNSKDNSIKRVSVGFSGEANGESTDPVISGDGTVIAFTSYATNLTAVKPADISGYNVYAYVLSANATILISQDPKTGKGVGGTKPSISNSGTRIAFCSFASSLTPNDNNNLWDIFIYDVNRPIKRVSLTSNGGERNQGTESSSRVVAPSISGDGQYVAFATTATNMVPDDNNNAQDVFVVNVETGNVVRASVDANGMEGNGDSPIGQGEKIAISFDGKWTAFSSIAKNLGAPEYNIFMHNSMSGQTKAVTTIRGSSVAAPVMSVKGSYIIFGMGSKLDTRFASSGIFAAYTGAGGTRFNQ